MPDRLFEQEEITKPTTYRGTQVSRQEDIPRQKDIIETIKASLKKEYPIELPKTTESREFVAGQISEEEQERLTQNRALKKEYINFFMTQTNLKDDKYWQERLPTANLPQLEDLYGKYQEWQTQQQNQFAEQLGIPTPYVEQLRSVYPAEDFMERLMGAKGYMDIIRTDPSASAYNAFMSYMFPEKEPTLKEKIEAGEIPTERIEALERLGLLPEGIEFKEPEPTIEEKGELSRKVLSEIEEGKYELKDLPIDYLMKYDMLNEIPTTDLVGQGFLLQEGVEEIAREIQGGTPVEELIPLLMEIQGINENIAKLYILKAREWLNEQQQ